MREVPSTDVEMNKYDRSSPEVIEGALNRGRSPVTWSELSVVEKSGGGVMEASTPLVSVVINNYNYGRFLREAVDSALDQTYPATEVVVVDDGSTDDSREVIAGYGDRIVPVLKENGGQASAFNAGFAASKGGIVCFLDSDDVFVREKVSEVVGAFDGREEIGWCFHPLRLVDGDTGAFIMTSNQSPTHECDYRSHIEMGKLPFIPSPTSGLCFTRSLLELILPMPEAIRITSDQYLTLIAMALSKGFFLGEELALLRLHGNNSYTTVGVRNDKQQWLRAGVTVLVAYWARIRHPAIRRFTDKLFARGLGTYWRVGGVEPEYDQVVEDYLSSVSPLERIEIKSRALYHLLQLRFPAMLPEYSPIRSLGAASVRRFLARMGRRSLERSGA